MNSRETEHQEDDSGAEVGDVRERQLSASASHIVGFARTLSVLLAQRGLDAPSLSGISSFMSETTFCAVAGPVRIAREHRSRGEASDDGAGFNINRVLARTELEA